jgi:hypothetical protein
MNGTYSMTSTLFPTTPLGTAYAELGVQVGSSGVNDVFYAPDSEGTVTINAGAIPAGCVIGTATFTCTNAVVHTIMFPVVFNTATTVKVGLTEVASAFETVTIDPFLGGDLTGITLYNAGGQQITGGFSITSGSGAVYDADGIVSQPASASVPEPSSAMLLAFMVLGVAAIVGKRIAVRI